MMASGLADSVVANEVREYAADCRIGSEHRVVPNFHGIVEGWGDLVLPDRTLEALRLRRTFTQNTGGFVLSWSIIDFHTNNGYKASISLDMNGNVQSASYNYIDKGGGVGREELAAPDLAST